MDFTYCTKCGGRLTEAIPEGDDKPRAVCGACGQIHYVNPKIVTGCLISKGSKVLLCRRAIDPRAGYWTFPAGFLESGETTKDGAIRETREEACAEVVIDGLYAIFELPYISQLYMFYRARLKSLDFKASFETSEIGLFEQKDIPWENLAFRVIQDSLVHYFEDRDADNFPLHKHVFRERTLPRETNG